MSWDIYAQTSDGYRVVKLGVRCSWQKAIDRFKDRCLGVIVVVRHGRELAEPRLRKSLESMELGRRLEKGEWIRTKKALAHASRMAAAARRLDKKTMPFGGSGG